MADIETSNPRIIVALDFPDSRQALGLVDRLDPKLCRLKVGKELFTRSGPQLVRSLQERGFDLFLDLKFHDIPATVSKALIAASELGVWMVNVHAAGGRNMLEAGRNAVDEMQLDRPPLLIAVTVLTSMNELDLAETGVARSLNQQVDALAAMASDCGLDGVVCSAHEASRLRSTIGEGFCLVTPGIRPAGSAADDQTRIMTPAEAFSAGSDFLVIGRPVTQAADPVAVLQQIAIELESGA